MSLLRSPPPTLSIILCMSTGVFQYFSLIAWIFWKGCSMCSSIARSALVAFNLVTELQNLLRALSTPQCLVLGLVTCGHHCWWPLLSPLTHCWQSRTRPILESFRQWLDKVSAGPQPSEKETDFRTAIAKAYARNGRAWGGGQARCIY